MLKRIAYISLSLFLVTGLTYMFYSFFQDDPEETTTFNETRKEVRKDIYTGDQRLHLQLFSDSSSLQGSLEELINPKFIFDHKPEKEVSNISLDLLFTPLVPYQEIFLYHFNKEVSQYLYQQELNHDSTPSYNISR